MNNRRYNATDGVLPDPLSFIPESSLDGARTLWYVRVREVPDPGVGSRRRARVVDLPGSFRMFIKRKMKFLYSADSYSWYVVGGN